MKSALRQNLRSAELEKKGKDLNNLQEQLAKHMGKKPKNSSVVRSVAFWLIGLLADGKFI